MLCLETVDVTYGGIRALREVSFTVGAGEVVALLGANGAGKSSTLRAISGLVRPTRGEISFQGRSITGQAPETLATLGLAHVPEGRQIFPGLTVLENLEVAAIRLRGASERRARLDRIWALFPRLAERQRQLGWSLSGGEQQMLAIGRALMGNPVLLLLDEPSLGLAPALVQDVFATLAEVARSGTTILLVEQNAGLALALTDRAVVLQNGVVVAAGPAADLAADPALLRAYLGTRREHGKP